MNDIDEMIRLASLEPDNPTLRMALADLLAENGHCDLAADLRGASGRERLINVGLLARKGVPTGFNLLWAVSVVMTKVMWVPPIDRPRSTQPPPTVPDRQHGTSPFAQLRRWMHNPEVAWGPMLPAIMSPAYLPGYRDDSVDAALLAFNTLANRVEDLIEEDEMLENEETDQ